MLEEMSGISRETVDNSRRFEKEKSVCSIYSSFVNSGSKTSTHCLPVLGEMRDPVLSLPPCSPNLAPADFFLFPKLRIAIKGTRFGAVLSIQQTVTRELKAIREEAFPWAFYSLHERCKRCAEVGGNYTERWY
jgi:hypothetical protein